MSSKLHLRANLSDDEYLRSGTLGSLCCPSTSAQQIAEVTAFNHVEQLFLGSVFLCLQDRGDIVSTAGYKRGCCGYRDGSRMPQLVNCLGGVELSKHKKAVILNTLEDGMNILRKLLAGSRRRS